MTISVNGTEINESAIDAEMNRARSAGYPEGEQLRDGAIQELILRRLMLEQAEKLGIAAESDEEMSAKAKKLMQMIQTKIPSGIIKTIKTPVAQREVIAAFAEMIGVPRNGLSKLDRKSVV